MSATYCGSLVASTKSNRILVAVFFFWGCALVSFVAKIVKSVKIATIQL
jgi:hypothetical protein